MVAQPQTGTVITKKVTIPSDGTGFGFTEDIYTATGPTGSFNLDDGQNHPFINVQPGTYIVTEDDPTGLGFDLTDLQCDDGNSATDVGTPAATINLELGETVTCTFTNNDAATG